MKDLIQGLLSSVTTLPLLTQQPYSGGLWEKCGGLPGYLELQHRVVKWPVPVPPGGKPRRLPGYLLFFRACKDNSEDMKGPNELQPIMTTHPQGRTVLCPPMTEPWEQELCRDMALKGTTGQL